MSIEDPLSEDDWDGWKALTDALGDRVQIVGDDLFVTNPERLARGIDEGAANALLVKVNQIGTLTETLDAVDAGPPQRLPLHDEPPLRRDRGHHHRRPRGGDRLRPDQDRRARPRSERVAKYNQLLRIEEELDDAARYAGAAPSRGRGLEPAGDRAATAGRGRRRPGPASARDARAGRGARRSAGAGGAAVRATGAGTGRRSPARLRGPRARRVRRPSAPAQPSPAPAGRGRPPRPGRPARPPRGVASRDQRAAPRRLTGRAAVLALSLSHARARYAYPLREYLASAARSRSCARSRSQQRRRVAGCRRSRRRWDDPAYVEAQARERLHFVMPGETSYVVLEPTSRRRRRPGRQVAARRRSRHRLVRPVGSRSQRRRRRGRRPATADGQPARRPSAGDRPRPADRRDLAAVAAQLGRPPARRRAAVAHRCPCGAPTWSRPRRGCRTARPFPTLYYLTCPRAPRRRSARSRPTGLMREMTDRLGRRPGPGGGLPRRARALPRAGGTRLGVVPEIAGVSAGGMPDRVKCLHVLVAHSLAGGPGREPARRRGARRAARLVAQRAVRRAARRGRP